MLNAHMAPIIGMTEGLFIFPSWVCVAVVTLFANANQFLHAAAHTDAESFETGGGQRWHLGAYGLWFENWRHLVTPQTLYSEGTENLTAAK